MVKAIQAVVRHRQMPDPAYCECSVTRRSGWSIRALRVGQITWSMSLWNARNRVRHPGAGSASSRITGDCGVSWPTNGTSRISSGELSAVVRGAERDQGVHPCIAPQPLHVVAGDQPAETVADHVNPLVAGVGRQLLHRLAKQLGGGRDVAGQQAVVVRRDGEKAAATQRAVQQGEDRVVVDDAMDQQDRRFRRIDVVVDQAALFRAEPVEIMPPDTAPRSRNHDAHRVGHQVGRSPAGLHQDAGRHPGNCAGEHAAHRAGYAALHSPILPGGKLG